MDENGMSNILSALIERNGDGWGGNNGGIWFLLLFFMLAGCGGGWGGNHCYQNYATSQEVNSGFQYNQLNNDIRANANSIAQLGYQNLGQANNIVQAVNNVGAMTQHNFCDTNRNIDAVRYDGSQNTCSINRNIDAVRAEMAQNTCAITTNATSNTQKILDTLCQMRGEAKDNEIAKLRTDLQAAQLTLAQGVQTQNIIGALKPYPVPAYITASPYAAYAPYAFPAYNNGGTTIV